MSEQHYLKEQPELWEKLEAMLMSEHIANIELAFQMMQGIEFGDIPKTARSLMIRNGNNIGACLKYGFVEALVHLKQIYLKDVEIESLPNNISLLNQLQRLEIRNSYIQKIPSQIAFLNNLASLDLHGHLLENLPDEIGYLQKITIMELSQGKLISLNGRIAELRKLQKLKLAQNQLQSLPEAIWNLPSLSFLDLSHNQLTSLNLPYKLRNRRNPMYLFLTGNPLPETEKEQVIECLPFAKITF